MLQHSHLWQEDSWPTLPTQVRFNPPKKGARENTTN